MRMESDQADRRTFENNGVRSLFDTEVNIKIRVLTIIAIAGAVGNTLGFLANLFLYGLNFVTGFCAFCAVLILLYLFFGLRSKYNMTLGYIILGILDILEFPLLMLTYGAVMVPYLIIGFHALTMLSEHRRRLILCSLLGLYDVAVIVYASLHPYLFGPQDAAGLLGSAVITFVISLLTVASLVIMWQRVYLVETIEIDPVTKAQSQVGFYKNAAKILKSDVHGDYYLLYFNVCSFKAINSIFGIDGGNRFLHAVADRLNAAPFSPRLIGRLSADRFVCLVEKQRFRSEMLEDFCTLPFEERGRHISALLNCGIYEITDRTLPVSSMCDRALATLHFLHREGSRYYAEYDSAVDSSFREETEVLGMIDQAIQEQQFRPYYQPIVDSKTGKIVSAEALARWIHPEHGVIPPSVFIPVLEKKDMISHLDSLIAGQVNQLIRRRITEGKKLVPISLNLSRNDLYDKEMMRELHTMVRDSASEDHWYRFEITESAYEAMSDHILRALSELRKSGASILVDDFGSGYSSLGMITDYEFDTIKLDMQFAAKIDSSGKTRGVVQSLIDMAHKMGAKVVAEGIETEAQLAAVTQCGCDYIQGYYFYRPLPESEFLALLDSQD